MGEDLKANLDESLGYLDNSIKYIRDLSDKINETPLERINEDTQDYLLRGLLNAMLDTAAAVRTIARIATSGDSKPPGTG